MSFRRCEPAGIERRGVSPPWVAGLLAVFLLTQLSLLAQSARKDNSVVEAPTPGDAPSRDARTKDSPAKEPPVLPAAVIVNKMMLASAQRSAELRGFRGTRLYHLQYHGLLVTREASLQVLATYIAPDQRNFTVISQSGSKLLINRVLLKLLDSEKEALRNQSQVALSPANYAFEFLGTDRTADGNPCYILGVRPHKDNKFLYRGKIWVDAHDFAVLRMEGQPAKSPSFWIRDTQIESKWAKVGEFWLIQHNHSVSHIRMGGVSELTIDYTDYQITGVDRHGAQGQSQSSELPDPSSVNLQH
jgi:hypothetical protein